MAFSKAFIIFSLGFALALAFSSEVSARQLLEKSESVEESKYGHGYHGGHSHYGGGGHMHYGGGGHGHYPPVVAQQEDKAMVDPQGHYGGGHYGGHYGGGHGGHYGGGGHGHYPPVVADQQEEADKTKVDTQHYDGHYGGGHYGGGHYGGGHYGGGHGHYGGGGHGHYPPVVAQNDKTTTTGAQEKGN